MSLVGRPILAAAAFEAARPRSELELRECAFKLLRHRGGPDDPSFHPRKSCYRTDSSETIETSADDPGTHLTRWVTLLFF